MPRGQTGPWAQKTGKRETSDLGMHARICSPLCSACHHSAARHQDIWKDRQGDTSDEWLTLLVWLGSCHDGQRRADALEEVVCVSTRVDGFLVAVLPCQNVWDRIPLTGASVIPVGIKEVLSDSGSFPLLVGPSQTRFSPVTAEERVQICLVQRCCFADIRANDQIRFRPARKSRDRMTAARLGGRIGFGIRSQRGGPQVLELLAMNCGYCDVQMPRDAVRNVSLWYVTSTRRG
jgi:hypothetical protein